MEHKISVGKIPVQLVTMCRGRLCKLFYYFRLTSESVEISDSFESTVKLVSCSSCIYMYMHSSILLFCSIQIMDHSKCFPTKPTQESSRMCIARQLHYHLDNHPVLQQCSNVSACHNVVLAHAAYIQLWRNHTRVAKKVDLEGALYKESRPKMYRLARVPGLTFSQLRLLSARAKKTRASTVTVAQGDTGLQGTRDSGSKRNQCSWHAWYSVL